MNTLPKVADIVTVGVVDSVIVFDQPFDLESLLRHASDYLKKIFGDDFPYEKANLMFNRGDITEAQRISNGKDRVDEDNRWQDGAHFRMLYDSKRTKCWFECTDLRWNMYHRLMDWYTSTVEPLDALSNPMHHVIDRLVFDRFIWTLPNGREIYRAYRGSKLVRN